MAGQDFWKYCTTEEIGRTLRTFDLLKGLDVPEEAYLPCLYTVSNQIETHYHPVVIPKKSGGRRKLLVPDALLRTIQRNLLHHVLEEFQISEFACAYKKGTSIVDNARPHVGAKLVLKLDIQDFFDQITWILVYQNAFPGTHFPPAIRKMLTEFCCVRDRLPQGAPTSPTVSNLVMRPFDVHMGEWCRERKIRYTRYCDDLTFSGAFAPEEVIRKVRGFLQVYGFELNRKKTRVLGRGNAQSVTGIVVNEKAQVSRAYRRKLRQEVYLFDRYGIKTAEGPKNDEREQNVEGGRRGNVAVSDKLVSHEVEKERLRLLGKMRYVLSVNPEDVWFGNMYKKWKVGADSRKRTEEMQGISEEGGVAMKARVNEGCISCGACVATCPEVFRFDENDLAVAYADVTDETEAQAKEARDGCPVDVIDLEA